MCRLISQVLRWHRLQKFGGGNDNAGKMRIAALHKVYTEGGWHSAPPDERTRKGDLYRFMKCCCCGNEAGSIGRKRLIDGECLCRECSNKIPKVLKDRNFTSESACAIVMYENELRKNEFNETSNYRRLLLDETHGTFAIDTPDEGVFYCLDLSNVSLYCGSPKATRKGVVADIEFACEFAHPAMKFSVKLGTGVPCHTKRVDSSHVTWEEPPAFTMFRSMFNQMLDNERSKYKAIADRDFYDKAAVDAFKARALFMVSEDYTMKELRERLDCFTESFEDTDLWPVILNAYDILVNARRKEGAR